MERALDVRGAQLSATIVGAGPRTFVWSHGLTASRANDDTMGLSDWSSVVERMQLVRYDARGHGQSSSASDPDDVRWSELGLDMLGVADAVGAGRFVAGGASMGCATALHAAVATPERIEALVLQIPPTAWETRAGQAEMYAAGVALLRQQPERALDLVVAGLDAVAPLGEVISREFPEATEIMKRHMRALDPIRLATVFEGASRSDLPPPDAIARVQVPALVLAWEGDNGHPLSTAERLHELLPNSELHVAHSLGDVREWPETVARFL